MSEKPPTKYSLIWAATITPATRKLVLLSMANYSEDDGTRIWPAVATIAGHCELGVSTTAEHIRQLVKSKFLSLVKPATQHWPAWYALNLGELARARQPESGCLSKDRQPESGCLNNPDSQKTPSRQPESGYNPKDPDVSQGREGSVPPGSAAARPPRGPAPQLAICPEWVDKAALQRVGERNPQRNMSEILATALEYRAKGATPEAINAELVDMDSLTTKYKLELRLTVPKAPPKPNGRTSARKPATVVDTRAPGRYDSMKARSYHAN